MFSKKKKDKNLLIFLCFKSRFDIANISIFSDRENQHIYVKSCSKKLGISDRVFIVGPQSPQVVATLLNKCTVFVSASKFEGRPMALLEALAAGCLTLLSRIPAHEEVIQDHFNGYLFDPTSSLSGSMAADIVFHSDAASIKINAVNSVKTSSWDLCAKEYKQVYSSSQ